MRAQNVCVPSPANPPVALTVAGSDNSAGAGAQADLKTFSALGVYGLTAITCIVAEVPGKVSAIQPATPEIVAEQMRLCFASFPVAAVKTGMLFSREIIAAVCEVLEKDAPQIPLVVDPVMVATSGDPLLETDAIELYKRRLFPRAALVTPNLGETRALLGREVRTLAEMRAGGRELLEKFGAAWLLKGGHLKGSEAADLLFHGDGKIEEFSAPFVHGVSTHGTGCTYAAAITAGLARGHTLSQAVAQAKTFVTQAISRHFVWNNGTTHALNHFATG